MIGLAHGLKVFLCTQPADMRRSFDGLSGMAVTIIELLDAQDASLNADAAAADSQYRFLTTIMALQRATGGFDFLLGPGEREALATTMRDNFGRPMR